MTILFFLKATFDAVRKWRYQPTTINGGPVEVATEVDVTSSSDRGHHETRGKIVFHSLTDEAGFAVYS
jgi:hypothetical protein